MTTGRAAEATTTTGQAADDTAKAQEAQREEERRREEEMAVIEAGGIAPPPPTPTPEPPPEIPEDIPPEKPDEPEEPPFKPDFTKDNPYEGATKEDFERESSGFVPTEDNPLPPSLATEEGRQAREEVGAPLQEQFTFTVGTDTADPVEILRSQDLVNLRKNNPDLFKTLEKKGIAEFNKAVKKLQEKQEKELEQIRLENLGITLTNRRIQAAQRAFNKANRELPDGKFVDKKELERIKKDNPAYWRVLILQGFDKGEEFIQKENDKIRAAVQKNELALSMLEKFTTVVTIPGRPGTGGTETVTQIDGAAYLRQNPGDTTTLNNAGFKQPVIKEWQEFNKLPYVRKNPAEAYWDFVNANFKGRVPTQIIGGPDPTFSAKEKDAWRKFTVRNFDKLQELRTAAFTPPKKRDKPPLSKGAFIQEYLTVRGVANPLSIAFGTNIGLSKKERQLLTAANAEYERLYGLKSVVGSDLTTVAQLAFLPARALKPEVEIQDIGGVEWALGAANATLIVVAPAIGAIGGAVGSIGSRVAQGAAVATFGTTTALEWKGMSDAERVINVALDVALVAALYGRPLLTPLRNAMGLQKADSLTKAIGGLTRAVNSRNVNNIRVAADRLHTVGLAMKVKGVAGADKVIRNSRLIWRNAGNISKRKIPSNFEEALRSLGRDVTEFAKGEAGSASIEALTLRKPQQAISTRLKRTAVIPITRKQASKFGLTESQIDAIFAKVGNSRSNFIKEARRLKAAETKGLFNEVDDYLKTLKRTKIEGPQRRVSAIAEEVADPAIAEARKGIQKAGEQESLKLALTRTFGESETAWANRVRRILKREYPNATDASIEAAIKDSLSRQAQAKASSIVREAQKNDAMFNKLADRALERVKAMRISLADLQSPTELNQVVALLSPAQLQQQFTRLSTKQQEQVQTLLDTETAQKLKTEQWTGAVQKADEQTDLLAEVVAANNTTTDNKTDADTLVKQQAKTKTELKPSELTKTKLQQKTITETTVEPKLEVVPDVVIKPIIRTVTTIKPPPEIKPPEIKKPPPKPGIDPPVPPPPPPPPPPGKKIRLDLPPGKPKKKKKPSLAIRKGKITWKQRGVWYTIKWPYASKNDVKSSKTPPKGAIVVKGPRTAMNTIQLLTGKAPQRTLMLDLGIQDIFIRKPTRKPGKKGAIKFKRDIKQKTKGDISLKGIRA